MIQQLDGADEARGWVSDPLAEGAKAHFDKYWVPGQPVVSTEVAATPSAQPAAVQPRRAFCTACGSPLEEGAKFCTACGAKVG